MKTTKTFAALATVGIIALLVIAWNPSNTSFNTNQFDATAPNIQIKSGVLLTNPTVTGTITGGLINATNESTRQATSITNGAINNLSNYVNTVSLIDPYIYRIGWWFANGSVSGGAVGFDPTTQGTTANVGATATTPQMVSFTTAGTSNSAAGLIKQTTAFPAKSFHLKVYASLASTANICTVIGLSRFASTAIPQDPPDAEIFSMLRYCSTNSHWFLTSCYDGNLAHQQFVDTGISADTSLHSFELNGDVSALTLTALIDGVSVATLNNNINTNSIHSIMVECSTQTAATKTINVEKIVFSQTE